jgi:hypothetical protein
MRLNFVFSGPEFSHEQKSFASSPVVVRPRLELAADILPDKTCGGGTTIAGTATHPKRFPIKHG